MFQSGYCVFCEIIAGREPATFYHQDEQVVVFRNRLRWVPVMLLVVPREHMTQDQLWRKGDVMARAAQVAVDMGQQYCPNGFRLLSNSGYDALQSQEHGHIHVLGGTALGRYA